VAKKEIINPTVDKLVGQYVAVRDRLRDLDEAHDKKRKPIVDTLEELNGKLQVFLDENKLESVRTQFGTCYMSTRWSASLADPQAFMDYVIQQGRFELIDRRANSTAVRAFVEEEGSLPPGCKLSALRTAGVRRGNGAKDV
jgi:hypothetical protein